MKAVPISAILFLALVICIIINVEFIECSSDFLSMSAHELTQGTDRGAVIDELERFWKENRELMGLSISPAKLESVGSIITSIRWAYQSGSEAELLRYCTLLSDSAQDISKYERISLTNIF